MRTVPEALALALRYHQAGSLQQAEQIYQQILQVQPQNFNALHLLGVIAHHAGRSDRAVEYISQAVRLAPRFAEAHNSLGIVLAAQGKLEEAVASYQQALRLKPDNVEAHNNLGSAFDAQGKLEAAVGSYQQALRLKPDFAQAHSNLGQTLTKQGNLAEAVASLQQALRLEPDFPEALSNLGAAFEEQGKPEAAVESYQQALRLKPNYAQAHSNLGVALMAQGKLDAAVASYQQALRLKPDAAHFHSKLVFVFLFHPGYDAKAILEECQRWNQQHAEPLKRLIQGHSNHRDPERRLRIGYVSPDFRDHVQSFFTIPLLSHHDHRQFEIFCYANVVRPHAHTGRLRGHADVWRNTVGLSDQQVADQVRSDQIDILVDLTMHMANNRLLVFARKPAPIQVTWLAYPGTTGLSTIDYRLTDPSLDPPGLFDAFYSEESIRLPDSFWCYDPLTDEPPVDALPALENGFITFGCLNTFWKVNDGCLALWAQVLQAVPRSRLLLLAPRGQAREHVLARLERESIAAPRVEFADRQPRLEYLKLYHRIDMALDPLPYNGHTTSLDAFWMGVPTLTLVSTRTAFGRAGWSQLSNLGLQELAAETPEQYMELAARLAGDLSRLEELRSTLRQRMLRSPLMDGQRFARSVEQAYRQMWHRWCSQPRPAQQTEGILPEQPIPC